MATLHDAAAPRKKMATYGKAARRRIPEYGQFPSTNTKPQVSESYSQSQHESHPPTGPPPPTSPTSLKPIFQRPKAPIPPRPKADVFDMPSDDEPQRLVHKKATPPSPPVKQKTTLQRSKTVSPASSPAVDLFDVPSDDEVPTPKPVHRVSKPPLTLHHRPKPLKHTAMSKISSPPLKPAPTVFDVPSSDEEVAAPIKRPIPKIVQKATVKQDMKGKSAPVATSVEDTARRKKLKLSPPHEIALKRLPANTIVRPQGSRASSQPPKGRLTSPKAAQFTRVVVARPRKEPTTVMPVSLITPLKPSPAPQFEHSTPSPLLSEVDMMELDPRGSHISPRGLKMWQGLLDSAENSEDDISANKMDGILKQTATKRASPIRSSAYSPSKPMGVSKYPQRAQRKVPRRRLIDSLVEQREQSSDEDSSDDNDSQDIPESQSHLDVVMAEVPQSQLIIPEPLNPPVLASDSQGSQGMGLKVTYARQRSMLAEQDLMVQLAMDLPAPPPQDPQGRRPRRGSIPTLKPLSSFLEEDEDDEGTGAAIRSVHELRKSGANNRFLDEVQDFLERIGTPTDTQVSMRRSGLLDLASKMQDKAFARQFRENGMEQKLFVHLGQENDIIAGFIMISLLIFVMMDESLPHIVAQLRRQGITRLLIRLLNCQSSIASIGKERKSNMSKSTQILLGEHHDNLLKAPVWETLEPQLVSPRTAALKCLELMVRQTRESGNSGDIFSKELTTNLFSILKSTSDDQSFDLPKDKQAIDFYLALSALESHSITARTMQDETIWIDEFLPIIADTLEVTMSQSTEQFGVLQSLVLRLTLNVTNNNSKASDVFARPPLMSIVGQALVTKFNEISRFLTEDNFLMVMDHLILILGAMINFAEWSSAARGSLQSLQGSNGDPLDAMVQTFVVNQEKMSEADSIQESQKNVAYGYLSVLLGYLSLNPAISKRIQARQPNKTLRPLVASIEEFIGHHKRADTLIAADEEGHNPQAGLTERLEALVSKLVALEGFERGN